MNTWRPFLSHRLLRGTVLRRLLLIPLLWLAVARATADDEVSVPGGPGSVRRLFGLDPERPSSAFFLDLHEVLLFGSPEDASWSNVEARRKAVFFVEDLAEWRRLFGDPARFAPAPAAEWNRCEQALDWLGFNVQGDAASFETERRPDGKSVRRQSFLDVLGTSTADFLGQLRAGGTVTVAAGDATAPLPFGLAAWRDTLSEPGLTAENAFLFFLQNVRASRMLVALNGLDPETREELRGLLRDAKGRPLGWRVLYEEALEPFSRYPEALRLRDGRFLLPAGADADPIWTDTFGVSSERAAFLKTLYMKDAEKGAYVVDTLQHLREEEARELLFGASAEGPDAVNRFRGLYEAIEPAGENYRSTRRDPYDFAHLAPFLRLSPQADSFLPGAGPEDTNFPRDEAELAGILARERGSGMTPEESLRRLLRQGSHGKAGGFSTQRRFLFLSSLLAERPALADPGLAVLLDRGFDRFHPAYAILEDFPFSRPELARRYLFTLDRLDRRGASREAELRAGLFQGHVELLAQIARAKTLEPPEAEALLSALLDVPLFAREDVAPRQGETALFAWLSDRLLPALRRRGRGEEDLDSDELIGRALAGPPAATPIEWRGGRYRFDPAGDESSRRRAFRETQRLTWISDLEALHRERDAALVAAERGDLEGAKAATAELALGLRLPAPGTSPRSPDERIDRQEDHARGAAANIAALPNARELPRVSEGLAALDAVLVERHLEALLGHVYSGGARDPEDLYYQDPSFVARHSFRTVERGGPAVRTPFASTTLVPGEGGGSRIAGSLFGLPDVLGLLHADQLEYRSGARVPAEEIRSGLVAPIWRMSVARLDDDSLEVVAASCLATRELAGVLAAFTPQERFEVWDELARDLVPRSRLALLASLEEEPGEKALSSYLSPSDLYRIGRRLLRQTPTAGRPLPSALRAREAMARLEKNHGEAGARERLAEFGPRAEAYAGRSRLADIDMPPYERLAAYRRPQILSERLYDLKIAVACRVVEARLPAAVLPIVLPAALDAMLAELNMAYPYDWSATTRAAFDFSRSDLDRILDDAVRAGRLVRDDDSASGTGAES